MSSLFSQQIAPLEDPLSLRHYLEDQKTTSGALHKSLLKFLFEERQTEDEPMEGVEEEKQPVPSEVKNLSESLEKCLKDVMFKFV